MDAYGENRGVPECVAVRSMTVNFTVQFESWEPTILGYRACLYTSFKYLMVRRTMNSFTSSFPASHPPPAKITNRLSSVYWTTNFLGSQTSTTSSPRVFLPTPSTVPEHLVVVLNTFPNIPIVVPWVHTGIARMYLGLNSAGLFALTLIVGNMSL